MAPELASAASDAAGSLVEQTGRRLAAGMADELGERLNSASGGLAGLLGGGLQSAAREAVQVVAGAKFEQALNSLGVTVVASEELDLLRSIAVAAATGGDQQFALDKLKTFHAKRAGEDTKKPA